MKIVAPAANSLIHVASQAEWPSIRFCLNEEIAANEQVTWGWQIHWHTFSKRGTAVTAKKEWDAKEAVAGLGGMLTVTARCAHGTAAISVQLAGTNPAEEEILAHLALDPNSAGFDKILRHETQMMHFDANGQPKASFDSGFGICQLTKPVPTYEQCWSWKQNINAGLALFAEKRAAASAYLSMNGRSFTEDQLTRETVSRWNGGPYHVWSATRNAWIRNPMVLCDSKTGNIGWDMTKPMNRGRNESILHSRDAAQYRRPPGPMDGWKYFGICYADSLLGPPKSSY